MVNIENGFRIGRKHFRIPEKRVTFFEWFDEEVSRVSFGYVFMYLSNVGFVSVHNTIHQS
jgi:hypothetical protein